MSITLKLVGGPLNDSSIQHDSPLAPGDELPIRRPSRFLAENEIAVYVLNGDNELHFTGIRTDEGPQATEYGMEMICPSCVKFVSGSKCPACGWEFVKMAIPDRPKPRFEPFNVGIFWFHVSEADDKSLSLMATDADDELIAVLPGRWPSFLEEVHVKAIAGWWLLQQMRGWAVKAEELVAANTICITSLPDDDVEAKAA